MHSSCPTEVTLPAPLYVPAAHQWVSATTGRIAPDGYSWMQAVCWAHIDGTYRATRGHGPQHIGDTTLRVAVELARLAPCRPGIDYLVHVLKLSKRTVQYHLGILREAGLLAYRAKGTRVRGEGGRASEFVWTIPPAFDTALRLTTRTCDRYIRALQGIAEEGRTLMKRLGKMARKLMRRPRRSRATRPSRTRSRSTTRCTPMEGGSESSSTAGVTPLPPEAKLGHGASKCPAPKKSRNNRRRTLNAVGRRYQLARELVEQVDWLRGCSVARIAWVARDLADAGWSAEEVRAWLHFRGEATHVHRASGLLAVLLRGAERVLGTAAKRADAVNRWREDVEAARRARIRQVRARAERYDGDWQAPRSAAVRRLVAEAFAPRPEAHTAAETLPALDGPQDLTVEELQAMRDAAWAEYMQGDTALVTSAVEAFGRPAAEAMYGLDLVQRALHLSRRSPRMSLTHR
ncbi:winged helix-turn-helix domain-containing protein [Streptomyces sp. HK10]|uniref:helix-turn-helix domain-containing protein n=1 Tax=Streptomyces sp. HK10 TaxID=3373255 RepID=UPI00374969F6